MANFCINCGKELRDGVSFCSFCGQPVTVPAEAVPAGEEVYAPDIQPQPYYDAPAQETPAGINIVTVQREEPKEPEPEYTPPSLPNPLPPVYDEKNEQITTWGFFGINMLMCVPIVNLIFLIVWACGGCRKRNKRSYARGMLLACAAWIIISIGITVAMVLWLAPYVNEFFRNFGGFDSYPGWRDFGFNFNI